MLHLACPSCGADLPFRSGASVYAVCPYCGSTVVRTDGDVWAIGTVAALPDEVGPVQVGSEIRVGTRSLLVVGRARMGWADGGWNEWFLQGDAEPDGQTWLTEAQGSFALSDEIRGEELERIRAAPLPTLGEQVRLGDNLFRVADNKVASVLGSEGELPFRAVRGRTAIYVDMIAEDGGFAGIEESDEGRRLYVGTYLSYDQLGLTHPREIEGWSPPGPRSEAGADTAADPLNLPPRSV